VNPGRPEQEQAKKTDVVKRVASAPIRVFGKVLSYDDHRPVPAADLFLIGPHAGQTNRQSASDGSFEINLTRAGTYQLYARKGDTWSFFDRGEIVELRAEPGFSSIGPVNLYLSQGVEVEVLVRSLEKNKPIPNAKLQIGPEPQQQLKTDSAGRVTTSLPADLWTLAASASGFAPTQKTVDLSTGQSRKMTLQLGEAGVCSGRVTNEEGQPLEAVSVRFTGEGGEQMAHTNEQGSFRIENLPQNNRFSLVFEKQGYSTRKLVDLWLDAQNQRDGLRVVLKHSNSVRQIEVEGLVINHQGTPLEDVAVTGGTDEEETRSDARGHFRFPGLVLEEQNRLFFEKDGYAPRAVPIAAPSEGDREEIKVRLVPAVTLQGRVLDDLGDPIPSAKIRVVCKDNGFEVARRSSSCDEQGVFQLFDLTDELHLQVAAHGFHSHKMNLSRVETKELNIVLQKQRHLEGIVVDGVSQQPVPRFILRLINLAEDKNLADSFRHALAGIEFEGDGHFRIPAPVNAPAHQWVVLAEGYQMLPFTVKDEEERTLTLSQEAQSIRGEIDIPEGVDLPTNFKVTLLINFESKPFSWVDFLNGQRPESAGWSKTYSVTGSTFDLPIPTRKLPIDLVVQAPGFATTVKSNALKGVRNWASRERIEQLAMAIDTDVENIYAQMGTDMRLMNLDVLVNVPLEARLRADVNLTRFPGAHQVEIRQNNDSGAESYRNLVPLSGKESFSLEALPPGSYTFLLWGSDGEQDRTVLARAHGELVSGDVFALELGFDEVRDLSGRLLVRGVTQPNGLLYLMSNDLLDAPRRTWSDEAGFFRFNNLSAETQYWMVYLGTERIHPNDLDFLINKHPNKNPVKPGETDTRNFLKYGSIRGRVANETVSWGLVLLGETEEKQTYYRVTAPDPDGLFYLTEIPPGTYRLSRTLAAGPETLASNIVLTDAAEALDLGDLTSEGFGSLRFIVESPILPQGFFSFAAYPDDGTGQLQAEPLFSQLLPRLEAEVTLEAIPEGPILGRFKTRLTNYVLEPELVRGEVFPDRVTTLRSKLVPVTDLEVTFPNIHGELAERNGTVAVQMIHRETGEVRNFERVGTGDAPINDVTLGQALFTNGKIRARGLLTGVWDLEIVFEQGEPTRHTITLVKGQTVTESYF